jgi:hypothetical protein
VDNCRVVRRVVVFTFVAALAVFCVVQDRVTAAGAHAYAEQSRAASAHLARGLPVDMVMRPAIRRSVRLGLASAAAVFVAGFGAAFVIARGARG